MCSSAASPLSRLGTAHRDAVGAGFKPALHRQTQCMMLIYRCAASPMANELSPVLTISTKPGE
jgi:hypothetical protein